MKTKLPNAGNMLLRTEQEVRQGKKLIEETKRRAKRAKGKLARHNAKRMVKLLDRTVDSIEDHHNLLASKSVKLRAKKRFLRHGCTNHY